MAVAEKTNGSILRSVAEHEQSLLVRLEQTREEAKRVVEQSRAEARRYLSTVETRLAEDVARIRREAEERRMAEFEATVGAADERLSGVRSDAMSRVSSAAEQVLKLFLPSGVGGRR